MPLIPDFDSLPKFKAEAIQGSISCNLPTAICSWTVDKSEAFRVRLNYELELNEADALSLCKSFPEVNSCLEAAKKEYVENNRQRYISNQREGIKRLEAKENTFLTKWQVELSGEELDRYKDVLQSSAEYATYLKGMEEHNIVAHLSKVYEKTKLTEFLNENRNMFKTVSFVFCQDNEVIQEFKGFRGVERHIPAPSSNVNRAWNDLTQKWVYADEEIKITYTFYQQR